jgi:large subunit ribosomal protein L24
MKIKVNDTIKIMSGKDRGKTGKVIQVFPIQEKVVVENVNVIKRHLKTRKQGEKGQVLELAAPFSLSNVQVVCPHCSKTVRIGYKMDGDKKKRFCRKCQGFID